MDIAREEVSIPACSIACFIIGNVSKTFYYTKKSFQARCTRQQVCIFSVHGMFQAYRAFTVYRISATSVQHRRQEFPL